MRLAPRPAFLAGREELLADLGIARGDLMDTIGVLTSIAGFCALVFSGLPGLAQLGVYSIVGLAVAALSTLLGLAIGLITGYVRRLDAVVMRVMDGLMSIPSVLLAIALMALTKASIGNVIVAITLAEVPRVVRLVRSLVLSLREQPYVEAAIAAALDAAVSARVRVNHACRSGALAESTTPLTIAAPASPPPAVDLDTAKLDQIIVNAPSFMR